MLILLLSQSATVLAYGESGYYAQSGYYGESTYYSQPAYYTEAAYYSESGYDITFTTDVRATYNVDITGSVAKGAGSFVIDHPLDPENKLLYHSFVESPEAKNIYDGIATLDAAGSAVVALPDYFETLNKDYRILLTPMYQPMPGLYVGQEVGDNTFTVSGGVPNGTVSWQVTGNRKDPFILANPIINEVEKGPDQIVGRGEFLSEEARIAYEASLSFSDRWQMVILDIVHNIKTFFTNLFESET